LGVTVSIRVFNTLRSSLCLIAPSLPFPHVELDPDGLTIGADGDGTVCVGAKDSGAEALIALDDRGVRMAKATVAQHGNHRHVWVHGAHKGRAAGCTAAMIERLAPPCEPVAAARRPRIQAEPAVGRPRPLARQRHLATADQPGIREGLVGGATRARGHHRRARADAAGDVRPVRGVGSFRGSPLARHRSGSPRARGDRLRLGGVSHQNAPLAESR
jgi:hypothetical protein